MKNLLLIATFTFIFSSLANPAWANLCYIDFDGDGYGDQLSPPSNCLLSCDNCADPSVENNLDCNDFDFFVHPGAMEVLCNGKNDDCQAGTPDDTNVDGDPVSSCNGDCDDNNPNRYPGNAEYPCDMLDNDCDPLTPDDPNSDSDPVSWCNGDCDDSDPNRYPGNTETPCDSLDNDCNPGTPDDPNTDGDLFSLCSGDCDDGDPNVYPGAFEITCNGKDDDCDPVTQEDPNLDGDPVSLCAGDCDDSDPLVYPGVTEILCNLKDDDCNGATPDDQNVDGDPVSLCFGDCNDDEPSIYPGIPEYFPCDGIDGNCNGMADEGGDLDGDGWGVCGGDCDDTRADINPDMPDYCDYWDNDCDSVEGNDDFPCNYSNEKRFGDADHDGYLSWQDLMLIQRRIYGQATAAEISPLAEADHITGIGVGDLLLNAQAHHGLRILDGDGVAPFTIAPPGAFTTKEGLGNSVMYWTLQSAWPGETDYLGYLPASATFDQPVESSFAGLSIGWTGIDGSFATALSPANTTASPVSFQVLLSVPVFDTTGAPAMAAQAQTDVTVLTGICGDLLVQPSLGEECDIGAINGIGCDADCTLPECNDGIFNVWEEQCDDGGQTAACDADCTTALCGDGTFNATAGEECDEGNTGNSILPDALCRPDCTLPTCGDEVTDSGEDCDAGALNSLDPDAPCRPGCLFAGCGDGILDSGEECDDAGANSDLPDEVCRTNCTFSGCGDGIVDTGEECDEGASNSDAPDAVCRTDCTNAGCGDGIVDSGETCDVADDNGTLALCGDATWLFNGKRYCLIDALETYNGAEAACEALDGHLVAMDDLAFEADEDAATSETVYDFYGAPTATWIGLDDLAVDGTFEWVTGVSLLLPNWSPGEPDSGAANSCTILNNEVWPTWNNIDCTDSGVARYACEFQTPVCDSDCRALTLCDKGFHWSGDGNHVDQRGGYYATPTGDIQYTDGLIGYAFSFPTYNGDTAFDYLDLPHFVLDGQSQFTIALWVRDAANQDGTILSAANAGQADEFVVLNQFGAALLITAKGVPWDTGIAMNDGAWHHLVVTYNEGQVTVSLDNGVQTAQYDFGAVGALSVDAGGLIVGEDQDSLAGDFDPNQSLEGLVDELLFFTGADNPSAADLNALYVAGQVGTSVCPTSCGNGIPDPGEVCDDGITNGSGTGACEYDCMGFVP